MNILEKTKETVPTGQLEISPKKAALYNSKCCHLFHHPELRFVELRIWYKHPAPSAWTDKSAFKIKDLWPPPLNCMSPSFSRRSLYLGCAVPLSWEVWEDTLPSKEFPGWHAEREAFGGRESDCVVSQTTCSPFGSVWKRKQVYKCIYLSHISFITAIWA